MKTIKKFCFAKEDDLPHVFSTIGFTEVTPIFKEEVVEESEMQGGIVTGWYMGKLNGSWVPTRVWLEDVPPSSNPYPSWSKSTKERRWAILDVSNAKDSGTCEQAICDWLRWRAKIDKKIGAEHRDEHKVYREVEDYAAGVLAKLNFLEHSWKAGMPVLPWQPGIPR